MLTIAGGILIAAFVIYVVLPVFLVLIEAVFSAPFSGKSNTDEEARLEEERKRLALLQKPVNEEYPPDFPYQWVTRPDGSRGMDKVR